MNNEPVAWMLNGILHEFDPSDWAKEEYPEDDVIPLYTHPADLTDEEIEDIASNLVGGGQSYNILFARAILRKAQEK